MGPTRRERPSSSRLSQATPQTPRAVPQVTNMVNASPAWQASKKGPSPRPSTLLAQAVQVGDVRAVQRELQARQDCKPAPEQDQLNLQDGENRFTPLHVAARAGDAAIVQLLLEAGANKNVGDVDGLTPLHHATKHEHLDVVELLLINQANPNTLSVSHYTPVHFASRVGNIPLLRALLEARGRKDIRTKDTNSTPIHLAVLTKNHEVLRCLIDVGIQEYEIDVADKYGYTALQRASQLGLERMVRILVCHGASRSYRGKWDWTALHWAANYAHVDTVKALLELGCNQGIEDNDGNTPYDVTESEAVRVLLNPNIPRITARESIACLPCARSPALAQGPNGKPLGLEPSTPVSGRPSGLVLRTEAMPRSPDTPVGSKNSWRQQMGTPCSETVRCRWAGSGKGAPAVPVSPEDSSDEEEITPFRLTARNTRKAKDSKTAEHNLQAQSNKSQPSANAPHPATAAATAPMVSQVSAPSRARGRPAPRQGWWFDNLSDSSSGEEDEGEAPHSPAAHTAKQTKQAAPQQKQDPSARPAPVSRAASVASPVSDAGSAATQAYSPVSSRASPTSRRSVVSPAAMSVGYASAEKARTARPPALHAVLVDGGGHEVLPESEESRVPLSRPGNGWHSGLLGNLQDLGFDVETVEAKTSGDLAETFSSLWNDLQPGDCSLVLYSGPAVASHGERYMIPGAMRSRGTAEKDMAYYQGLQLDAIAGRMSRNCAAVASAVVGDCRDSLARSDILAVAVGREATEATWDKTTPGDVCHEVIGVFETARRDEQGPIAVLFDSGKVAPAGRPGASPLRFNSRPRQMWACR